MMKTSSSVYVVALLGLVLFSSQADARTRRCKFALHLTTADSIFYMDTSFKAAVKTLVVDSFTAVSVCYSPNQAGTSCFSYSTGRKTVKGCNIHLGFDCDLVKGGACTDIDAPSLEGKHVPSMMSDVYVKTAQVQKSSGWAKSMPEPVEHEFIGVNDEKSEVF